jgi:hypothetical protein
MTSFLMELMVYPAIYEIWKWHFEMNGRPFPPGEGSDAAVREDPA